MHVAKIIICQICMNMIASIIHEFFLKKSSFIIINDNTMDDEFWSNHNIQNTTLQNAFLLYITTEYNSIELNIFFTLSEWLKDNTFLKQSRNHFFVYQKLAIFLQIVGKEDCNQDLQKTFQHSGPTISLVFYEMLNVILILHQKTIILPTISEPLDSRIVDNTKYFPYFKDCLGVLDNIHLLMHLPLTLASLYCK